MAKSRENLNKLKIYHISDKEAEVYKQNKKNRYLQKYLDTAGKSENLKKNIVYDSKGLYDFFSLHDASDIKLHEKSRRITLKNYIGLKFQAVSLILVFTVMIFGTMLMRFHTGSYDYDAANIADSKASIPLEPIAPARFIKQVYEAKHNAYYMTIEALKALNQNLSASDEEKIRELTGKFNMVYINQHTIGMQNGCEITSLAMAISRDYGDISVHDISEKYLEKKPLTYSDGLRRGDDPTDYYIGNPESNGYGIFAPGLTKTATKVLQAFSIRRTAYDISGCSEEELFAYVSQNPVIIWYTKGLDPVKWDYATWYLPNNKAYSYPLNLHCAVLVDYTEETVTMYDPAYGFIEYDRGLFLQRWSEIGPYKDRTRQAVVIR